MKTTYGNPCFQIALDEAWVCENEKPEEGGLTFVNSADDVRLYISAGLINPKDRDLATTATEMNAFALGSLARDLEQRGGKLQKDVAAISVLPPGFQVETAAEVTGAPDVQQQMLLVTVLHPLVWAVARMSSKTLRRQELQKRWRALRDDFMLVQATRK